MKCERSACYLFLAGFSAILQGSSVWKNVGFNKWPQRSRLHYYAAFNKTIHICMLCPVLRRALSYFSWNTTSVTIKGYHCASNCWRLLITSRHEPHPNWKSERKLYHQTSSILRFKEMVQWTALLTPEDRKRVLFRFHFGNSAYRSWQPP
jgi:hypothetical protein